MSDAHGDAYQCKDCAISFYSRTLSALSFACANAERDRLWGCITEQRPRIELGKLRGTTLFAKNVRKRKVSDVENRRAFRREDEFGGLTKGSRTTEGCSKAVAHMTLMKPNVTWRIVWMRYVKPLCTGSGRQERFSRPQQSISMTTIGAATYNAAFMRSTTRFRTSGTYGWTISTTTPSLDFARVVVKPGCQPVRSI